MPPFLYPPRPHRRRSSHLFIHALLDYRFVRAPSLLLCPLSLRSGRLKQPHLL